MRSAVLAMAFAGPASFSYAPRKTSVRAVPVLGGRNHYNAAKRKRTWRIPIFGAGTPGADERDDNAQENDEVDHAKDEASQESGSGSGSGEGIREGDAENQQSDYPEGTVFEFLSKLEQNPLSFDSEASISKNEMGKTISQVLEISYRKVWIALTSAGTGKAYVTALEEFVTACVIAYKQGYSIQALAFELSMNEMRTGNPQVDSVVVLNENEKRARQAWVTLVYLTLYKLSFARESAPPKADDPQGLDSLVHGVTAAFKQGYNLDRLKLEQSLQKSYSQDGEGKELTKAQLSIRSQFMRIVFLTNEIVAKRMEAE